VADLPAFYPEETTVFTPELPSSFDFTMPELAAYSVWSTILSR
tara:strand:- start:455 stop:583 length:129 start_codon:yes stop_codon:yes gene_type:complete